MRIAEEQTVISLPGKYSVLAAVQKRVERRDIQASPLNIAQQLGT